MYRESDILCNENDEAPPELKNNIFREKWDCLSKSASNMVNINIFFNFYFHFLNYIQKYVKD